MGKMMMVGKYREKKKKKTERERCPDVTLCGLTRH